MVGAYAEYVAVPGFSQAPVPYRTPRDVSHRWAAGHRLRLAVATTDLAFMNTRQPGVYTVRTGGTTGALLRLPTT